MAHDQAVDVMGRLKDQPVDIGKGPLVARDFANNKGAHAAKTGKIKALRLLQHEIGD